MRFKVNVTSSAPHQGIIQGTVVLIRRRQHTSPGGAHAGRSPQLTPASTAGPTGSAGVPLHSCAGSRGGSRNDPGIGGCPFSAAGRHHAGVPAAPGASCGQARQCTPTDPRGKRDQPESRAGRQPTTEGLPDGSGTSGHTHHDPSGRPEGETAGSSRLYRARRRRRNRPGRRRGDRQGRS